MTAAIDEEASSCQATPGWFCVGSLCSWQRLSLPGERLRKRQAEWGMDYVKYDWNCWATWPPQTREQVHYQIAVMASALSELKIGGAGCASVGSLA